MIAFASFVLKMLIHKTMHTGYTIINTLMHGIQHACLHARTQREKDNDTVV